MSTCMYPIQDGPSVPCDVMTPHESQCQRNHGQSIQRIAERGGFGCAEAWAVINGWDYYKQISQGIGHIEAKRRWIEYAERINNHYERLEQLECAVEMLTDFLRKIESECQGHTEAGRLFAVEALKVATQALKSKGE